MIEKVGRYNRRSTRENKCGLVSRRDGRRKITVKVPFGSKNEINLARTESLLLLRNASLTACSASSAFKKKQFWLFTDRLLVYLPDTAGQVPSSVQGH